MSDGARQSEAGLAVDAGVRAELQGDVLIVRLDDGKANAISHSILDALHEAFDRAGKQAKSVLIVGRPGRFCAGFDLNVMRQGGAATLNLVAAGADLAVRLYSFPQPVVIACTGHALAMGAILLMAADARIGARGPFKIGLNEVSIGMTLPSFAVELARDRLALPLLSRAVASAEVFTPEGALQAGFLDRVAEPEAVVAEALAEAQRLAELPGAAHHETKLRLRRGALARMAAAIEGELRVASATA